MELCKTRVPNDTWRRSAACKGAPAEKNIQLNSSAAHCYAWAAVIVVALLMPTASDHRGSVTRAATSRSRRTTNMSSPVTRAAANLTPRAEDIAALPLCHDADVL